MRAGIAFPPVPARDLGGHEARLPDAFAGRRKVVIVAFQRKHQALVDSWVLWLEEHAAGDPGLRFYEVPTIGRVWAPVRNTIFVGSLSREQDRCLQWAGKTSSSGCSPLVG
jgi:hypothetical protein